MTLELLVVNMLFRVVLRVGGAGGRGSHENHQSHTGKRADLSLGV